MSTQLHSVLSAKYVEPSPSTCMELLIDATIEGERDEFLFVYRPDDPFGDMNPAITAWFFDHPDFEPDEYVEPPEPPPYYPTQPTVVAAAFDVQIDDGIVTGIGAGAKISAGFALGTGLYMLFFDDPQPDTQFFARVWDTGATLRCVGKDEYSITIAATDANGDPVDPAGFSVEIIRVL